MTVLLLPSAAKKLSPTARPSRSIGCRAFAEIIFVAFSEIRRRRIGQSLQLDDLPIVGKKAKETDAAERTPTSGD